MSEEIHCWIPSKDIVDTSPVNESIKAVRQPLVNNLPMGVAGLENANGGSSNWWCLRDFGPEWINAGRDRIEIAVWRRQFVWLGCNVCTLDGRMTRVVKDRGNEASVASVNVRIGKESIADIARGNGEECEH